MQISFKLLYTFIIWLIYDPVTQIQVLNLKFVILNNKQKIINTSGMAKGLNCVLQKSFCSVQIHVYLESNWRLKLNMMTSVFGDAWSSDNLMNIKSANIL